MVGSIRRGTEKRMGKRNTLIVVGICMAVCAACPTWNASRREDELERFPAHFPGCYAYVTRSTQDVDDRAAKTNSRAGVELCVCPHR